MSSESPLLLEFRKKQQEISEMWQRGEIGYKSSIKKRIELLKEYAAKWTPYKNK